MKTIELTQNKYTLVDDEDFEWLSKYKWSFGSDGYAYTWKNKNRVSIHRVILQAQKGQFCDHINLDRLDNQRINLRTCTRTENQWNRGKTKNNTSGFKGVYWNRKWVARIGINGKKIHLGWFEDKIDAAKVYDRAAKKYFGSFARLNFSN